MWFTIHSLGLGTKLRYLFIMASIWIKCNSITNVTKSATFQFHSLCKLVHIALSCLAYSIVIHWGEEEAKAGVSEVWSLYNSEKRTLFFYQIYLLSPQFCKDKPFTSWPAYIWNWKQGMVKVDGRPSRSRRGVDDLVAARLSATANRLTYCSLNPDLCFLLAAPCPQLQHMLFQSCQDSCFNRKNFVLHFELQTWIFWPGFLTKDTCGVFPEKRLFSCGLANCSQAITGE